MMKVTGPLFVVIATFATVFAAPIYLRDASLVTSSVQQRSTIISTDHGPSAVAPQGSTVAKRSPTWTSLRPTLSFPDLSSFVKNFKINLIKKSSNLPNFRKVDNRSGRSLDKGQSISQKSSPNTSPPPALERVDDGWGWLEAAPNLDDIKGMTTNRPPQAWLERNVQRRFRTTTIPTKQPERAKSTRWAWLKRKIHSKLRIKTKQRESAVSGYSADRWSSDDAPSPNFVTAPSSPDWLRETY